MQIHNRKNVLEADSIQARRAVHMGKKLEPGRAPAALSLVGSRRPGLSHPKLSGSSRRGLKGSFVGMAPFEAIYLFTQTHNLSVCLGEANSGLVQKVNKSVHFRAPYAAYAGITSFAPVLSVTLRYFVGVGGSVDAAPAPPTVVWVFMSRHFGIP